jgi:hypothetical protein
MPRPNVLELTDAQVLKAYTGKVFREVSAETPPIPGTYAGKFVVAVLVAVNAEITEGQMDSLEVEIDAIVGVHKSFVLIGPARIPTDRQPVDNDLIIKVRAGFDVRTTPTP